MTEEQKELGRMVLGYFGADGGYEPGGFTSTLLTAYSKADPQNRYRIRMGFPVHADMMDACMNTEHGIADLQKAVAS